MTPTRYMNDLLEATNKHVDEYLADLEAAERAGTNRALVINRNFDMLALDMDLRFMQTVGCVKALALLALADPFKTRLAVLLERTLDDLAFMESRSADNDLRPRKPGNDHNTVCLSIAERFDASLRLWSDLSRDIAGIGERFPLASAGPAIVAQIMLDLDMLAEQFRDFIHDGAEALYEGEESAVLAA